MDRGRRTPQGCGECAVVVGDEGRVVRARCVLCMELFRSHTAHVAAVEGETRAQWRRARLSWR